MRNNKILYNNIYLNPFEKKIGRGISLITAVKNRSENLEKALDTWVRFDKIDEIIIVDWSSDKSIKPLIEKYNNKNSRYKLLYCLKNAYYYKLVISA